MNVRDAFLIHRAPS